jgi:predicted AlkP superfamily phosphohydrolase/phosphomutase
MYFKFSNGNAKKWSVLFCLFTCLQPSVASEFTEKSNKKNEKLAQILVTPLTFTAQPSNCIALRHGRTCYANVKLNWSSHIKQDYCIYIKQQKTERTTRESIQCWKDSNGSQIVFNFESNKKIEFQLISSKDNQVIAETAVEISWVHKPTPRKRRWRIF